MVTLTKRHRIIIGVGLGLLLAGMSAMFLIKTRSTSTMTIQSPQTKTQSPYPWHSVIGTVFWVGETEAADNGFITNVETAWDVDAVNTFGGVDDPTKRSADGVRPAAFEPKHNPFYFALPATEFDTNGLVDKARVASYWNTEAVEANESLFKGRWVEIYYQGNIAYAQWVDVGPFEEQDYDYVFGDSKPKNTFGLGAGIDVSPAIEAQLKFSGTASVFWRFIEDDSVPDGPWKLYPAITNKTNW